MHGHSPSWFILSSEATADIHIDTLVPAIVFTVLACVMVALRWYGRLCSACGIKTEDYFVTAALLLSIANTVMIGGEYKIDGHRKVEDASRYSSLAFMMKLVFAQSIFYHLSINLVKASFILQYTRLFSLTPSIMYTCYTLLVFVVAATAWGVLGVVFLCSPVQKYWDMTVPGKCMDAETHFWSTSIIGIVLDWTIWILPIPVVGGLKLPRRQRMSLLVVFGLGGFVCVVSILRLLLVREFAHENQVTKSGTYALILSTIEVNVALSCASLLVMKPLLVRYLPVLISEKPVTARQDLRRFSDFTEVFSAGLDDLEKAMERARRERRRDTMMSPTPTGVRSPR
ncbi:hypothetical protein T440DRAFT_545507 [Plenodomus tracheiphilus IPT5]|uniref:Rhodopsin domain-containing protein n=1 Tax=Plenodomus tracheiphilus IPT5 TaxID=1408161 RepID=A0A6A7AQX7_9PLEO|nr:hypothetical protein T440DRAFT_545507 [Plenodomus tracheiphilus IPT5]